MMTFSVDSLIAFISHCFWPMIRVLALFSTAPVFNEQSAAKKNRIVLAIIIAWLIAPQLPDTHIAIFSLTGLWVSAQQVIIGAAMGLTVQLLFVAVRNAGEVIGMQMGLSFASFFDASAGGSTPVIARILNLLATLLFLTFDGHLWLISIVADSFTTLPADGSLFNREGFMQLIQAAAMIFRSGVMLGLPIITLLTGINLALGLLNRLTPQLSIFVIGFPLTLSIGMVALSLIIFRLPRFVENIMTLDFENLLQVLFLL
ncbi:flagellar biosynthetic protein FliR [Pantoea sp.]|uniref:flagellar biosynthetic protein FliR n=1 Tax=Pantoea sp. TaxID=69393 RepID=UPI00390C8713